MHLNRYTLSAAEIRELTSVVDKIRNSALLYQVARTNFRLYVSGIQSGTKISRVDITRIFKNPGGVRYHKTAILYDFITDIFLRILEGGIAAEAEVGTIIDQIRTLRDMRADAENTIAGISVSLGDLLTLESVAENVPATFENEFFGYRRSSTQRDIIRFYLKTKLHKSRPKILTFVNEYQRFSEHWKVEGFGYYIKGTLYLIGHARSLKTDESLGLRLFALRPLGYDGILIGPLISMDLLGPIAARIVLIPHSAHALTDDDKALKPSDFVSKMIEQPSAERHDEYIEKIQTHVQGAFPNGFDEMLNLICNGTFSVVKGNPESDANNWRLAEMDTRYRQNAEANGFSFEDRFLHALAQGISGKS